MNSTTDDRLRYEIEIINYAVTLRDILEEFLEVIDDESNSFTTELIDRAIKAKLQPGELVNRLERIMIQHAHSRMSR